MMWLSICDFWAYVTFDKISHYFTNAQFLSKYIVSHNMVIISVCCGLNIFELSHLYQKIWHDKILKTLYNYVNTYELDGALSPKL